MYERCFEERTEGLVDVGKEARTERLLRVKRTDLSRRLGGPCLWNGPWNCGPTDSAIKLDSFLLGTRNSACVTVQLEAGL